MNTIYQRRVYLNGQWVIKQSSNPEDLVAINENVQYTVDNCITEVEDHNIEGDYAELTKEEEE